MDLVTIFMLFFGAAIGIGTLVLWISAIVSIANCKGGSAVARTLWILIVLFLPFVGSIVWFVAGKQMLANDR